MFALCPLYNTFLGFSPIIVSVYLVWEGILIDNLIDDYAVLFFLSIHAVSLNTG